MQLRMLNFEDEECMMLQVDNGMRFTDYDMQTLYLPGDVLNHYYYQTVEMFYNEIVLAVNNTLNIYESHTINKIIDEDIGKYFETEYSL